MATSSGSLAAAFESSGIKEVTPEPNSGNANGNEGNGGIVIPPMKDPADIQIPFIDEQVPKNDNTDPNPDPVNTDNQVVTDPNTDQIDYFRDFAAALGLEGEVEGSSFDDFKVIGQKAIAQYKEKVEAYENMFSADLVEHIKAGGTVETFYSYDQPTNHFQDAKFEDDDVENREALLNDFYSRQGIEEDQVGLLINNLKEKGTFNAVSDKILDQYKAQEKEQNEKIVAARKAEEEASLKARTEFINGVNESFDKGLSGVTVDKEILVEAKAASNPDAKGVFAMQNIKLNHMQEATVNAFIIALSKGKPFSYTPTKSVPGNGAPKPVSQIFNKNSTSGKQNQVVNTLEEMNSIFTNRRN